jgi:glutamine---fructose-6-phosphate transaminase (isomerizing)
LTHTYDEIRSQPEVWRRTISDVRDQWGAIAASVPFTSATQFLLVGSGSSLHIARAAAHTFQETTRRVARAVASSDVFLSSESVVPQRLPVVAFVISRSGETTEAVMAAAHLADHFPNVTVVGITCNDDTNLVRRSHHAINLPYAAERSVVMTRSFTSMLLALQVVAGLMASDRDLIAELGRLPELLDAHAERFEEFGQTLGGDRELDYYIYLGLGPNEGIAQDATLKLKEMTQTLSEAYNPLEFRHGPISIVRKGMVVIMLEGLRERPFMADLEADLKRHGARVAAIAPYRPASADLRLQLAADISDVARSALYMPPLQLIAHHRAVAAGLNPDQPHGLTQVVVLADVKRGR